MDRAVNDGQEDAGWRVWAGEVLGSTATIMPHVFGIMTAYGKLLEVQVSAMGA